MRMLIVSAVYVFLAAGVFAQQPSEVQSDERRAFANRQVKLVESYRNQGDYRAAECVLRDWLDTEPTGTNTFVMIKSALADLLREQGRNAEARDFFRQLAALPDLLWQYRVSVLLGLADIDLHEGHWNTSIEEWNDAIDISRQKGDIEAEATALRGLGRTWLNAGSPARSEPLLRRSLAMVEGDPTATPVEHASSLVAMAEFYRFENKLALAEDAWSRALALEKGVFGENHPRTAYLMEMVADVYAERGQSDLAKDNAQRAVDIMRQWFGDGSPATASAVANLAGVEQRAHTPAAAAKHYEAAILVLRRTPELRPTLRTVMQRYASLLKSMHRNEEAKALDSEIKAFRLN